MASDKDLVALGRVLKPHGVRGECCVLSYADSPLLFDALGEVRLVPARSAQAAQAARAAHTAHGVGRAAQARVLRIVSWRPHKDRLLMTFKGVDDRDQAEALRGCELMAARAELPPAREDEIMLLDLPGLEVRLQGGRVLGRIARVDMPAGQEVWVIEAEGREVLFPAVDQFVIKADPEAGFVVINPPEGLLDIYLGSFGEVAGEPRKA